MKHNICNKSLFNLAKKAMFLLMEGGLLSVKWSLLSGHLMPYLDCPSGKWLFVSCLCNFLFPFIPQLFLNDISFIIYRWNTLLMFKRNVQLLFELYLSWHAVRKTIKYLLITFAKQLSSCLSKLLLWCNDPFQLGLNRKTNIKILKQATRLLLELNGKKIFFLST